MDDDGGHGVVCAWLALLMVANPCAPRVRQAHQAGRGRVWTRCVVEAGRCRPGSGVASAPTGSRNTPGSFAPQDVLARGKSLYDAQCASCHAADARGVLDKHGPNLLQSGDVFEDQHGEHVAADLATHNPPINLPADDTYAISDYIHSIQATMGAQGSPPGRNPVGLDLQRSRRQREGW